MMADRRGDRRPWRRSKQEALLRGLVRCGACGSSMTSRYSQKRYYTCLKVLN